MKLIPKVLMSAGVALMLTSCAVQDPYGNTNYPRNYPSNNGVYRAPDGKIYRQGEVYRDRNGNVYRNGQIIRRDGGYYGNARNLPPGQAKKIYGGSAKDYNRGHNKAYKNNNKYNKNWNSKKGKKWKDRDDD